MAPPTFRDRWPRPHSLKVRLTVAFLVVTLLSLALLAVFTLVFTRTDVTNTADQQTALVDKAIQSSIAASYAGTGRWSPDELRPVLGFANSLKVRLAIADNAGRQIVVTATPPLRGTGAPAISVLPIIVDGAVVGSLTIQTEASGIFAGDSHLEGSLALAVVLSAAISMAIAAGASIVVSGRIAKPVQALTRSARSLSGGDWSSRVAPEARPREIGALAEAFNSMAESLEREDENRRILTAEVAHELRTPLAVLQASSEALVDGVLPPTTATFQSIHDEALRLSRMVEDLETLASAQAAKLHLLSAPIDLSALANQVALGLMSIIDDAHIVLSTELVSVTVLGDETRLRQVLANLVTNAVKFTPPGGQILLKVGPREPDAALVQVIDSGVGIPDEELPHLFERFWRSPSASEVAGSGIGLAVVAELVAAHRGTVQAQSVKGHGSTFTVTLPRDLRQRGHDADGTRA